MPERIKPTSQSTETERLAEGRIRERNFDTLQTHIPDVLLVVEHDTDPNLLTRRETEDLWNKGITYASSRDTIRTLEEQQKEPHRDLVKLATSHPGLRGVRDMEAGTEIQINPKTVDVFDEQVLDESLGDKGAEIVHKQDVITLELNPDEKDVKAVFKSLRRMLKRRGYQEEEISTILNVKHTLRVDTDELSKRIESGEITLSEEAWQKKIDGWSVVPRKIKSRKELEEAEDEARTS